jgi:hypothetical protein
VDQLEIYLKLIELEPEIRRRLIELAGGPEQIAILIAKGIGIRISAKQSAEIFGLTPSGFYKRLQKIKGENLPKIDPELSKNVPKTTRKRSSQKRSK